MASEPALAVLRPPDVAPRLGERLVASRLISEGQLRRALDQQAMSPRFLGAVLLELGLIDEDRLAAKLGEHLQVPFADLRREAIDPGVAKLIPAEFARKNVVLPIREHAGALAVAMEDPGNLHLVNDESDMSADHTRPGLARVNDAELSRHKLPWKTMILLLPLAFHRLKLRLCDYTITGKLNCRIGVSLTT